MTDTQWARVCDNWDAVVANFDQMGVEYVLNELIERASYGGKYYEEIMAGAITSAIGVYGAYEPVMYNRRGTLTDRDNIKIEITNASVQDSTVTLSIETTNEAKARSGEPLEGLILGGWDRPKDYWGPGHPKHPWSIGPRDLYAAIPKVITDVVTIPKDIETQMLVDALRIVAGPDD